MWKLTRPLDLYLVQPDGTGLTFVNTFDTLPFPQQLSGLSWLPDGTRILYSTGDGSSSGSGDKRV